MIRSMRIDTGRKGSQGGASGSKSRVCMLRIDLKTSKLEMTRGQKLEAQQPFFKQLN